MGKKRVILSVTNDLVIDQRVHRAASTLVEEGFEVCLVGRRLADSPNLAPLPYETRRLRLLFTKGKLFYAEYAFRLFIFLLFKKFDILVSNDLDTLLPNYLVSRIKRSRLIYDSHEYFTEVPELVQRPGTQKVWLKLERWIFPKLKFAMTVNQSIADIYEGKYKVKVGVVRNMPFRQPFPDPAEKEPKLLIYQGALNFGRGIEMMIEAMQWLPEYRLLICGKGTQAVYLRDWAKECGVMDRVEFTGPIHFSQLAQFTKQASLGFSLEEAIGENYRLALPNKLFDYIQSGVPCIVSNLPEMARIVNEYGVGIILEDENRDPQRLSEKVRSICEDQEVWKQFNDRCRLAAEQLIWEREREKFLAFFKD